jgi:hypothetical protein
MLVASLPDGDDLGADARALHMLVRRLLKKLSLQGRYAVAISRSGGRSEIRCAFELSADAERVVRAVDAVTVESEPGWASLHAFTLDASATARLLQMAGRGSSRRPRGAQTDE